MIDPWEAVEPDPVEVEQAIAEEVYQETGAPPESIRLIKDEKGNVIGMEPILNRDNMWFRLKDDDGGLPIHVKTD